MSTETVQPEDMKWLEKGVFGIAWSDGHQGVYPIRYLRLHCPCAACTDEWTGELKLKPDDVPMFIMLKDIQPVGHYALRLIWSDGHDTGLYASDSFAGCVNATSAGPIKIQPRTRKLPAGSFKPLLGNFLHFVKPCHFFQIRRICYKCYIM